MSSSQSALLPLESSNSVRANRFVLLASNLSQCTTCQIVDHTVDLEVSLLHGIDNSGVPSDNLNTGLDVQLTHVCSLFRALKLCKLIGVLLAQFSEGLEPDIEQAQLIIAQGTSDSAAGSVSAEHDVLDAEVGYGVVDDGERAEVGSVDDVGDVAVGEDITRLHAEQSGLRHTRVGAAQP